MPTGTVGNPHFEDFANPKAAQSIKTHHLVGVIHQIRHASLTADFNEKLNLCVNRRFRLSRDDECPCAKLCFPRQQIGKQKGGTLAATRGNYWEIWEQICASSFSGTISGR